MTTYTITIEATLDAADQAEALDQLTEWLTDPNNVLNNTVIVDTDADREAAWTEHYEAEDFIDIVTAYESPEIQAYRNGGTLYLDEMLAPVDIERQQAEDEAIDHIEDALAKAQHQGYTQGYQAGVNAALTGIANRLDQLRHDLR
jgi:flagellar biosynthesis/type III secretory pathway protein FliH